MSKTLIELSGLSTGYGNKMILKDINFRIMEQDFIGIIGPNGGGKTTLLKIILGLLKPWNGSISYNIGNPPDQSNRNIGYLPQQNNPDREFPISVKEVILSGLLRRGRFFTSANWKKVDEILDLTGMKTYRDVPFGELSGGQMQRVLLGRAIISDPELLILDEPDTFVDNRFEHELYTILKDLNSRMAILLVSHDVGTISSYIKTIACVNTNLHYHPSNEISARQLKIYNCPIDIITHGTVPHRVLHDHNHEHDK